MGCDKSFFLSKELIYHFQMIWKISLNSMSNPTISTIWSQGWLSIVELSLIGEWDSD
jgi:hypothetical protein